jgi:hypothetical protein
MKDIKYYDILLVCFFFLFATFFESLLVFISASSFLQLPLPPSSFSTSDFLTFDIFYGDGCQTQLWLT